MATTLAALLCLLLITAPVHALTNSHKQLPAGDDDHTHELDNNKDYNPKPNHKHEDNDHVHMGHGVDHHHEKHDAGSDGHGDVVIHELRHEGLSYSFYDESCPSLHRILERTLRPIVSEDPGQAPGIMRVMFHDCFVQGCDASILLKSPTTEQMATPNVNSLRISSLRVIDKLKEAIEEACPRIVSCADIISLATVKSLALVGGPEITLPLGRRDGPSAANNHTVIANIPAPTFNFSQLLGNFSSKGLDLVDLVALSGSHTFGRAHCKSVDLQITPKVSTELAQAYAAALQEECLLPQATSRQLQLMKVVEMDVETPGLFDGAYYRHVLQGRVPFHSDAALLQDPRAARVVQHYARHPASFLRQFAASLLKMSQVQVLTAPQGEVRHKCSSANHYHH